MSDAPDLRPPQVDVPARHLWSGVFPHALMTTAIALPIWLWSGVARRYLDDQTGSPNGDLLWGLPTFHWYLAALAIPVIHQVFVLVGWRLQLRFRAWTRVFGAAALPVWGALFLPQLVARPVAVFAVAWSDPGSLGLPDPVAWGAAVVLGVPALYTLYSVKRYFGIPRALGGDHFYERYRAMPFVAQGAFKWSDNAMYTFAFLGLWAIALGLDSPLALLLALAHHALIFVHWYTTEKPDIELLYGD